MGSAKNLDVDQLLASAERAFAQRNPDAASQICQQVLSAHPDHPKALRILASIRFHAGLPDEAAKLLQRAIQKAPGDADLYNDYGALLLTRGRAADAIDAFERSAELEPNDVEARINLGNALQRRGRMADAEARYREALDRDPLNARGLASLGSLVRISGRTAEAIEYLRKAVERLPQAAYVHNFLGMAYRDAGDLERALACFEKAVQLQPDFPEAYLNLGDAAMGRRDFATAVRYLEKADAPISRTMILHCLLNEQAYNQFFVRLAEDIRIEPQNLYSASLSAYASQQLRRPDIHPFCPDPLNYVRIVENAGGVPRIGEFLTSLIDAVEKNIDAVYEPKGVMIKKGFQTAPKLFEAASGPLAELDAIVKREAVAFRDAFAASNANLIRDWPKKIKLNGWFVRLRPGGNIGVHNHPQGWLSGVIYLKLPEVLNPPEGSIEFTLRNEGYPDISGEHPVKVHDPRPGDLVFFPSSLFHRTIPFTGSDERLCIAFDAVADGSAA